MALSKSEEKKIREAVGDYVESKRPGPDIRPELDIGFKITGQSFMIFEIRPDPRNSQRKMETPVAKATYVKSRRIWKLYWMRADLKWHRYEPLADTGVLEQVLKEIDRDPFGCFWG